jgi:gag-polyprotein putative aspartyl protease
MMSKPKETEPVKTVILGAALAASIALAAPNARAEITGANSEVQPAFQTVEQFRAKWNNMIDRANGRTVNHACQDGRCVWEWELRPHVWAKMWESTNGAGQAAYCFLAEPATNWDCYGNDGAKWVWNPVPGTPASVASDARLDPDNVCNQPGYTCSSPSSGTPAPTATASSFSVPLIVEDGGFKTPVGLGSSFYNMTVDTGATSGLVTETVATALLVRGDATEIEGGNLTIADGSTRQERRISVANVTLNGHTIRNVVFGVGPNGGGMLFGLLPLSQFGRFAIDPVNSLLVFGG